MDESKRSGFAAGLALIDPSALNAYRRVVRDLTMPGQRRLHFTKESPTRRRTILTAFAAMDRMQGRIYVPTHRDIRTARNAALAHIVSDLAKLHAPWLYIERDATFVESDRHTIHQTRITCGNHEMEYAHTSSAAEVLLCISDALVWCYTKGGEWRHRVDPMITEVTTIDP